MRKILWLAFFISCCMMQVREISAFTVEKESTGIICEKVLSSGQKSRADFYKLSVQGETAYCVEPGQFMAGDGYAVTENFENFGIDKTLKDHLELISYYGYDYQDHSNLNYYIATQQMIWEALGATDIKFYKNGKLIDISKYKKEINDLLSTHEKLPSFAGKTYRYPLKEKIILKDTNQVLHKYNALSNGGNIVGDSYEIYPLSEGEYKYTFMMPMRLGNSHLFYSAGSQRVGVFKLTGNKQKSFDVNLEFYNEKGNIKVVKFDLDTGEALEGALFELYNEKQQKLNEGFTSSDGTLLFENLPYGKYFIKEREAPKGYQLQLDMIEIILKEENYIVKVNNHKMEMPVTSNIYKVYQSGCFCLYGIGIIFYFKSKKQI